MTDENGIPLHMGSSEGRIVYKSNGSTWFTETQVKDHLGSVHAVCSLNSTTRSRITRQVDAYYPFGMNIKELSQISDAYLANEYMYNGKMMQDEMGLNWLDYGARMYDAAIGRWHVPDPMVEEHFDYTPFAYVYNNPISFIDLFGLDTTYYMPVLPPVEITAERDKHAETMNNPIVQAVHRGQNNFLRHPLGHAVVWGWSYVVPIPYIEKGISLLFKSAATTGKLLNVVSKSLAEQVAKAIGGNLTRTANGFVIEAANNSKRQIVVRLMNAGSGGRPNAYYRVSIAGKEAFTAEGIVSTDKALTHVDINPETVIDDIKKLLK